MSVYFIRIGKRGPIKIGYSKDPYARRRSLQTCNAGQVNLIAFVPGERAKEQSVQKRFRHLWIRGDWFRPGADLVKFMAKLPSAPPAQEPRAVTELFSERLARATSGDTLTYKSPLEVAGSFRRFVRVVVTALRRGVMVVREGCEHIKSDGHDLLAMILEDGAIYD